MEPTDQPAEDGSGEMMPMEPEVMEPVMVEEVVEEVPAKPVFTPLAWDGKKIKKFIEMNDGMLVDISGEPRAVKLGGKKGVKIGKAIYFKGKKGVYVYFDGEFIKL